jgi:hypothetical protein
MSNLQKNKDLIIQTLRDSFKTFEGVSTNFPTLQETQYTALSILTSYVPTEKDYVKLTVVQDKKDLCQVNFLPENLYTYLLMCGIVVPYSLVENKTEYEGELGTYKLELTVLGPIPSFKPKLPLENITIDFKIGETTT